MEIKIEKGVPVPPKSRNGGRKLKYPFDQMEVGDSFAANAPQNTVLSSARAYARRNPGMTFTTREIDKKSCRVWRIA